MIIRKLTAMPYAQAHVEIDDNGTIHMFSYVTEVARIENDVLTIYGLYSMTTRRHLSAFCKEYTWVNDFQTIKALVNDGYTLNLETGEVTPIG